jgi:hypothetical protein
MGSGVRRTRFAVRGSSFVVRPVSYRAYGLLAALLVLRCPPAASTSRDQGRKVEFAWEIKVNLFVLVVGLRSVLSAVSFKPCLQYYSLVHHVLEAIYHFLKAFRAP